jgi:hypothetical protein
MQAPTETAAGAFCFDRAGLWLWDTSPGQPRLPEADGGRNRELHHEREPHCEIRLALHQSNRPRKAAEKYDRAEETIAGAVGLGMSERAPECQANSEKQAGEITRVAVEREIPDEWRVGEDVRPEQRPGRPCADGYEARERDGEAEGVSFRDHVRGR